MIIGTVRSRATFSFLSKLGLAAIPSRCKRLSVCSSADRGEMNGMKTAVNPAKGDRSLTENPQILIIGAGIAGISCGEYLTRNGLTNFKILEATDRTGGRIWSVELGRYF